MKTNKFELLEKKLNIATTLIEELDFDDYEIELPETRSDLQDIQKTELVEESCNEVFSLDTLKSDFVIIRQNILKLISTSQRVLDSCAILDPSDIKPATLASIAELQNSLGNNISLLVKVYAEVAKIEGIRNKNKAGNKVDSNINQGTVITNNTQILYSGSTSDLLSFMKENQSA